MGKPKLPKWFIAPFRYEPKTNDIGGGRGFVVEANHGNLPDMSEETAKCIVYALNKAYLSKPKRRLQVEDGPGFGLIVENLKRKRRKKK